MRLPEPSERPTRDLPEIKHLTRSQRSCKRCGIALPPLDQRTPYARSSLSQCSFPAVPTQFSNLFPHFFRTFSHFCIDRGCSSGFSKSYKESGGLRPGRTGALWKDLGKRLGTPWEPQGRLWKKTGNALEKVWKTLGKGLEREGEKYPNSSRALAKTSGP